MRRSVRLLREFRYEQPDPARFYTALAEDSVAQLSSYADLTVRSCSTWVAGRATSGRRSRVPERRTSRSMPTSVSSRASASSTRTVIGSGMQLPFRDGSLDLCYSSNVLEHVPDPWLMAEEMVRVTRSGGTVFISYTVWYGPHGGHETGPWHYLGGRYARRRYRRTHGHEPKNRYGESLFPVTVAAGLRWAGSRPPPTSST